MGDQQTSISRKYFMKSDIKLREYDNYYEGLFKWFEVHVYILFWNSITYDV